MKLLRHSAKHYCRLRDESVELNDLNGFFGANGSGKCTMRGAHHASLRGIVGACVRGLRRLTSPRDRSPMVTPRSPLALVLLLASSTTLADDVVARSFCDAPPYDQVCAVVPMDNTDFDAAFIYHNLEKNAQNPFDIFSWQTFVALN